MAVTRKARKRTNGTVTMSEVRDAVLKIASSKGEHVLNVSLDGTTVKLVTDRIRRIPRQAGLSALTVHQLDDASDGVLRLRIVNEGVPAVPWPKPDKADAKKATAKKATTRKATAKKATTRKATAKKATTRKATAKKASTR